jgi:hypothetical protein
LKLAFDWWTRDFTLAANTLLIFLASFNVFSIGLLADQIVQRSASRLGVVSANVQTADGPAPGPSVTTLPQDVEAGSG